MHRFNQQYLLGKQRECVWPGDGGFRCQKEYGFNSLCNGKSQFILDKNNTLERLISWWTVTDGLNERCI